jgi:hypothetical protein
MGGFDLREVGVASLRRLWLRGGSPRAFLARSDDASRRWRDDFILTCLERDIRKFGVEVPPLALRRLWMMLAHYHGQTWNASEFARSLGEAHTTVKRHLDILSGAMMVRQLQPWFENLGKRQVKAPKVYVRDSGVLHALLGLTRFADLESHPKIGASWEGFVIEQILRRTGDRDAYYWATPSGAELDLLVFVRGRRIGFEVKYSDAPQMTRSMAIARKDLALDRLLTVYPGSTSYTLRENVEVVAIRDLDGELDTMLQNRPSARGR